MSRAIRPDSKVSSKFERVWIEILSPKINLGKKIDLFKIWVELRLEHSRPESDSFFKLVIFYIMLFITNKS